ncbi:energy-coupled thiamine transporter ThiT [Priestia aryabhattai]|uniref:energy-coupled thiamine transporter ThiT n=1 Tax=Priestia aryabhattai TaxID=412384 RepID=UPI002379E9E8|nr:energy-coupled thiamine transporter ThiT [Priestia aryabhattai]WDL87257.1 energy-coupled thiamine transporter ThiT [Priestia aryabhattai]
MNDSKTGVRNVNKALPLQAKIEIAIFAALALLLDLLPSIKIATAVSISFSMVPIFIMCFRWGVKGGALSGLLWGLLQLATGTAYILTALQTFIEYIVAFAFIGFGGVFSQSIKTNLANNNRSKAFVLIVLSLIIGSFSRYFWHFIAGIIFWGSYAPKGMSALWYSFSMNGISMVGSLIACLIILSLLIPSASRMIVTKSHSS